jgi:thiol-disulfide isomerase/thioredoxin
MKKLLLSFIALLGVSGLLAQGVHMQEISFDEALRQAGEQEKLLFADFYTGWCLPCANMARVLETEQAAGDFFNPRFVNVKFDMEQGEGKTLCEKFNITGVPTYVIFAPDGSERFRRVGTLPLEAFTRDIARGMAPENAIRVLEGEFRSGGMSKERMLLLVEILIEGGHVERSIEAASRLLSTLADEEKLSPAYWPVYRDRFITPTLSRNFTFLLDHLDAFRQNVDEKVLDRKIEENFFILNGYLAGHRGGEELATLDSVIHLIHAYDLPGKARLEGKAALARALCTGDIEGIVSLLERHLPDGTLTLFDCKVALELVAARGDSARHQRLAALSRRLSAAAGNDWERTRVEQDFHAFNKTP